MEIESSHATTDTPRDETVPAESDKNNEIRSFTDRLLESLAEIGSIQEQEKHDNTPPKETKCSGEVCFYRFVGPQGFAPVLELRSSMRRVQEKGRELLKETLFPLFSTNGRELWTYLQLTLVLVFVLKIAIVDLAVSNSNERTSVDFVSLGLSLVFLLISILDVSVTIFLHRCNLFCTPCRHLSTNSSIGADEAINISSQERCGSFRVLFKYSDLFRMILNEVIVYTITICIMLQLILGAKQNSDDLQMGFNIASFIVAVLWKTASVYGVCIFVIVRSFRALLKIRNGATFTANRFHVHILLYAIGLILSQLAMFTMIGVKFDYENRDFAADRTVRVNGFLWYMLFGALLLPLAGVFTFAIPNFYSFQEYPIGYFLDFVNSFISTGELSEQDDSESVKSEVQVESIVQTIETNFTQIHNQSVFKKYASVFFSPLLVTLAIIYTLLIFAFLASYLLESDPTIPGNFEFLYGNFFGWTVFFVIFGTLVGLTHLLVVFIGVVWIVIIWFILLLFFVVIILAFACCMCFLAGNDSGRHCAESD